MHGQKRQILNQLIHVICAKILIILDYQNTREEKRKKRIVAVLMCGAMTMLGVVGCSVSSDSEGKEGGSSRGTTITLMASQSGSMMRRWNLANSSKRSPASK